MTARKKAATADASEVLPLELVVTTPPTDAEPQITDIAEYSPMAQALADVRTKYAGVVFDYQTPKGLESAKTARVEIREVRYSIQNAEKTVLVPYQDAVKKAQNRVAEVKAFGQKLKDDVLLIETPIDEAIKAEEKRRDDEKAAKAEVERLRVEGIQTRITHFRSVATTYAARTAADIAECLENLKGTVILPEEFGEFEAEATIARDNAIEQMETLHGLAVTREATEAQNQKAREELERLQKLNEENERKLREEREERERIERKRLDDEKADLERQRLALQKQQDEQAERDAQAERDRQELAQLRAQLANPAPAVATVVHTPAPAAAVVAAPVATDPAPEAIAPIAAADVIVDPNMPTADEVIEVVAMSWCVTNDEAAAWLRALSF